MTKKNHKITALDYGIYLLQTVPKTENELYRKMLFKWYPENVINETIQKLKTMNLINDYNFAESYINSEVCRKWKPIFYIIAKLHHKWIDKNITKELNK